MSRWLTMWTFGLRSGTEGHGFRAMVLARIVEPTSKAEVVRVLDEIGAPAVSLRTLFRSTVPLGHIADQVCRGEVAHVMLAAFGSWAQVVDGQGERVPIRGEHVDGAAAEMALALPEHREQLRQRGVAGAAGSVHGGEHLPRAPVLVADQAPDAEATEPATLDLFFGLPR